MNYLFRLDFGMEVEPEFQRTFVPRNWWERSLLY